MGSGASAQSDGDDPMYGGGTYSGHPKPAQNPRTRGPRSFEELERSSSHTGWPMCLSLGDLLWHSYVT